MKGKTTKASFVEFFSGRDTPKNSNYSLITYVIFYYVYVCKSITQFSYIIWTCVADAFFFGEQEHIFREDLLGNAHILGSMIPIAASQHVMAKRSIDRVFAQTLIWNCERVADCCITYNKYITDQTECITYI